MQVRATRKGNWRLLRVGQLLIVFLILVFLPSAEANSVKFDELVRIEPEVSKYLKTAYKEVEGKYIDFEQLQVRVASMIAEGEERIVVFFNHPEYDPAIRDEVKRVYFTVIIDKETNMVLTSHY